MNRLNRDIMIAAVVGIVAIGLAGRLVGPGYVVKIVPGVRTALGGDQTVSIRKAGVRVKGNRDGTLLVDVRGYVSIYDGKLRILTRRKDQDARFWSEIGSVQTVDKSFSAGVRLGSAEKPVRAGDVYLLKIQGELGAVEAEMQIERPGYEIGGRQVTVGVIVGLIVFVIKQMLAKRR